MWGTREELILPSLLVLALRLRQRLGLGNGDFVPAASFAYLQTSSRMARLQKWQTPCVREDSFKASRSAAVVDNSKKIVRCLLLRIESATKEIGAQIRCH